MGSKLLSKDISEGQEAVQIPCTNDVDGDPMPKIKYITQCWYNSTRLQGSSTMFSIRSLFLSFLIRSLLFPFFNKIVT